MKLARMLLIPVILVLFVACGGEEPAGPIGGDGGNGDGGTTGAAPTPDMFIGTWEYGMRYPSGDEVPMLRTLTADGKGTQYDVETGQAGKTEFDWAIDGRLFKMSHDGMLIAQYDIVRCGEGEHVLKNANGLEETYRKK